jgi:predicted homoserine dehydrogenase-like protein
LNLYKKLEKRATEGRPIRIGMIGAGKFGTMFLAQALRIPAIHIVGIVDINPDNVKSNMKLVGWRDDTYDAIHLSDAKATGKTFIGDDWEVLVAHEDIEIIIECTGNPIAAVSHCLGAFAQKKNVINVTVEADAFCGLGLAQRAKEAGVIYSMAYGDQPALASNLVDWARTCGFNVVAAGRGHKWLPHFRQSTPDTVWKYWGLSQEQAIRGRLNPKIFNAFLDGSKPAIECAAIANATKLEAPKKGLLFPPGGIDDIPTLMRPKSEGGCLERKGLVEVISCLTPEGKQIPYDIRKGVWVVVEADTDYLQNCFEEYKVVTDPSGKYMTMYKRWHLVGLELAISIASVALRGEATGAAMCFNADVVAIAKRDLKRGNVLDGEGGYMVSGDLRPTDISLQHGHVPLGLAQNVTLLKPVKAGVVITWGDITVDITSDAFKLRKSMEKQLYTKTIMG